MPSSLEIISLILIIFALTKITIFFINPKSWTNFVTTLYSNIRITQFVFLIFAAVILYFLIQAGVTIVQILATTLFVSLLIGIGFAPYIKPLLKQTKVKGLIRQNLLYILIWIALMIWGLIAIFS